MYNVKFYNRGILWYECTEKNAEEAISLACKVMQKVHTDAKVSKLLLTEKGIEEQKIMNLYRKD